MRTVVVLGFFLLGSLDEWPGREIARNSISYRDCCHAKILLLIKEHCSLQLFAQVLFLGGLKEAYESQSFIP